MLDQHRILKTFFSATGFALLCLNFAVPAIAEHSIVHSSSDYQSPVSDVTDPQEETDLDTGPSDVASVSKFIKEFHRHIDEEVYWKPDTHEPVQGSVEDDNSSAPTVNQTAVTENEDEGNSSSVFSCNMERQAGALTVELVNSTRLANLLTIDPNITSRNQKADCIVLLFYARTCPFSCMAAPHYNALPRAFPTIKMAAVNALQYQSFNTQFGIVGVPTVILLHNGRPAAKFNDSEYTLEMFTRFITRHTGILPEEKMFVTSADFGGPVGSVVAKEKDYWLVISWLVIGAVGGFCAERTRLWKNFVEVIQNTWREAEAQHIHVD